MKVGIKLGKVKKFGIGWCIHHKMAADNAEGGSGQTGLIGLTFPTLTFLGANIFIRVTYEIHI